MSNAVFKEIKLVIVNNYNFHSSKFAMRFEHLWNSSEEFQHIFLMIVVEKPAALILDAPMERWANSLLNIILVGKATPEQYKYRNLL